MRLSNLFIYGSVCIIVAASVGFLIFKSLFTPEKPAEQAADARVLELEEENKALIDQSGKAIQKFSEKITSLNDDLLRSSRLLTEKDLEIIKLKELVGTDAISTELATLLQCDPSQVTASVSQLVSSHIDLQQRLKVVSNQLSHQMNSQAPNVNSAAAASKSNETSQDVANKGEPRIKKLELNAPANQWANANRQPAKPDANQNAEPAKPAVASELVQDLMSEIADLKADLKNREKLLFEQTSLIEDLKKKNRVETGFRTESGQSGTIRTVQPFQDRGTFKVKYPDSFN